MDGLAQMAGAATTLVIGGQTYRLGPLRARDYAEIEQQVVAERADPLAMLEPRLAGLPEAWQRHLLSEAYRDLRRGDRASAQEVAEWLDTPPGQVFEFWLALRRHVFSITLDEAEALLEQAQAELGALDAARGAMRGLPPGNSQGQPIAPDKQSPGIQVPEKQSTGPAFSGA